jgi:predicted nucleic acid-binding protein
VPNLIISTQSYFQAFNYCKDIDEKDTPYLALAIEFNIELITNDIELINGLRTKGFKNVISLTEFFDLVKK